MKRIEIGISLLLAVLTLAGFVGGQAQKVGRAEPQAVASQPAEPGLQVQPPRLDAGARLNPLKIALLHWYSANETTHFPVGEAPVGVAFDGAISGLPTMEVTA